MSADLSSGPANLAPEPSQPPSPIAIKPVRFARALRLAIVLLVLAAGGVATWWWGFHKKEGPARVPPIPAHIEEAEIATALEAKRADVMAHAKSAEAWGEYAMLLLAHLFAKEADECFAEAARLDPRDPRWPYGRGFIAVKRDPLSSRVPLDHLRQAIATTGPGDEYRKAARLLLAESLLERSDLAAAEAFFMQDAGGKDAEAVRARYGLGLIAVARGDVDAATRVFTSILNEPTTKKQARSQLAQLAHARGDKEAAAQFEREAAKMPDLGSWADPLYNQVLMMSVGRRGRERTADLLEKENRFDEAAQVYLAQLERERTPKALIGAGLNLLRQRRYDKALALFREAVDRAPTIRTRTSNSLGHSSPARSGPPTSNPACPRFRRGSRTSSSMRNARPS